MKEIDDHTNMLKVKSWKLSIGSTVDPDLRDTKRYATVSDGIFF